MTSITTLGHESNAVPKRGASPSTLTEVLGLWSSVLLVGLSVAALGIGIATPPRSGPFCQADCVGYPYTDVAAFVPWDFWWMYPAMLVPVVFIVLMACIAYGASDDRKLLGQIGLCFAVIAAASIATDYIIQLAVVQPSLLKGETDGLSLISQYNPHGVFIALEDIGYLLMGVAFVFAGAVFVGDSRLERAIRWILTLRGLMIVAALLALSILFGAELEYRFEVTALIIDWTALIVTGVLLSVRGVTAQARNKA
jgi:hypothetical protein